MTCDNWFTSIPLAKKLLQQPYKLTLVGTLRANKREIPEEMKNNRARNVGTSMFCYDGPLTLLSYKPKKSKIVYVLSSCNEVGTVNLTTKKPSMIEFYNSTKGGVDTFDQICSNMSCNRKTNRWPMCLFYGMINISCINSYIIYCHNVLLNGGKPKLRRPYMKKLQLQLAEPWLKKRFEKTTMPRHVKSKIKSVLNLPSEPLPSCSTASLPENRKRKICGLCPYKKRRMTKTYCAACKIAICGEHTFNFCPSCSTTH